MWIEDRVAGRLFQAGKWDDIGAMVVFQADSIEAVEAWLGDAPLVASGLMTSEPAEFRPAVEMARAAPLLPDRRHKLTPPPGLGSLVE